MALDKDAVTHIAWLARIRLTDQEVETMSHELSQILGWVEQLGEVDTADVDPMTSVVEMQPRLRPDAISDGGHADKILQNASEPKHGFFTVPKVVE